ncbi:AlpA family phage regulatory protein [Oryzomonas sagensis]|uniref:AlpA family phage regulatory protein n=2 Tax=Oryzomonas sagensis TaxID=2603857 RepID=A0ABQ6TQJ6_9BACT|nr:AlpA family phage regulatory protein [Oryzomonas sagensis]
MQHLPGIVGQSRSNIYRLEAAGLFPHRRKIGKRAVGWLRSEVEAWLANTKEA